MQRYRSKLSGPLLDRFDLVVDVSALDLESLATARAGESSAAVRERVVETRRRQRRRFGSCGTSCNAQMAPGELDRHAPLPLPARRLLLAACERFGITARGFDRVRRVARTLADMDGGDTIEPRHVAEALQYRHPEPTAVV